MVLPHPLLVLQPPGLGWGRARCCAGVCGSTAQPTSSSPDGAASILIPGETQPRALIWFDFWFFLFFFSFKEMGGCWAGEDPLWDRFAGM